MIESSSPDSTGSAPPGGKTGELSVYVHVPFCRERCPYCSFLSYCGKESWFIRYAEAVLREAAMMADLVEWTKRKVVSIYVGGGSPLILGDDLLPSLTESLRKHFRADGSCEVSVEANPEELDRDFAQTLLHAGVNRLSLGVQALDGFTLDTLGRRHAARHAEEAFDAACASGFDNVSCDLIFGVLGQSLRAWENTLDRMVRLHPEHISAYELRPGGGVLAGSEDKQCDMMRIASEILEDSGYERYEVSNFALEERRCLHNTGYWTGRDYIGIGAGAHSLSGGTRWANSASIDVYVQSLSEGLRPVSWSERPSPDESLVEKVFLGLRTKDGLSLSDLDSVCSRRLEDMVTELCSIGLASLEDATLRPTPNGLMLADEIASQLIAACGGRSQNQRRSNATP